MAVPSSRVRLAVLAGILLLVACAAALMKKRDFFTSTLSIPSRQIVAAPQPASRVNVGKKVGAKVCLPVSVAADDRDAYGDKMTMCKTACAERGDAYTYANAAVKADTGGSGGSAVQCECCDPASVVSLEAPDDGSSACEPGADFGISAASRRSMFARNGCKGVFKWMDGALTRCEATSAVNASDSVCGYVQGGTDVSVPVVHETVDPFWAQYASQVTALMHDNWSF